MDRAGAASRRRGVGVVAWPIVVATAPTAAFQLPNLFVSAPVRVALVVVGLLVLVGAVAFQVVRARRSDSARVDAQEAAARALGAQATAVRYAFGQVATRLVRLSSLPVADRHAELPVLADRIALALAFYLLPSVPDIRANVYALSPDLRTLDPIGHGGAGDTAGVFRAGTPYGDRNLRWVLDSGAPRVVGDRTTDVDCDEDDLDFRPRYTSYVSVVIRTDRDSFGMLTVDSPTPDAFTDLDVKNVAVMADFMALAFSLAYAVPPGRPTSQKGP